MGRRAFYSLGVSLIAVLVVALLVVALPAHSTRAQDGTAGVGGVLDIDPASRAEQNACDGPPTVDGLLYGEVDGCRDIEIYGTPTYTGPLREDGSGYRAFLYTYRDEGTCTLYIAYLTDRTVNDNVFGDPTLDEAYLASAGWEEKGGSGMIHAFSQLYDSDNAEFSIICGGEKYNWIQDYLYDEDYDQDPGGVDWLSDENGEDGAILTSVPATLTSASSLQWNMNNTDWDVTLTNTRSYPSWKSPDLDHDDCVTDEIGYPPLDTWPTDAITHETTISWEWPMIYEFSFDYCEACGEGEPIYLHIAYTHHSPVKEGEDEVTAVELLSFSAQPGRRAVVVNWETASEFDNLGFNLYRAEGPDGERVKVNSDLIVSEVPPGSSDGAAYAYTDMGLAETGTYAYWLEDVNVSAKTKVHGPVQVSLSGRPGLRNLLQRVLP